MILVPIGANRWCLVLKKMIGSSSTAQQCFNSRKFVTAMDGWCFQQLELCTFLDSISTNRAPKTPVEEDSTKKLQRIWWNLDELKKKWIWKNLKIWESFWVFVIGSEKSDYLLEFVIIRLIYDCLIHLIIIISQKMIISEICTFKQFGIFALGWLGSM